MTTLSAKEKSDFAALDADKKRAAIKSRLAIIKAQKANAMTRQQIVAFTAETGRRVAANEIGIAPRSEKHLRRLEELKRITLDRSSIDVALDELDALTEAPKSEPAMPDGKPPAFEANPFKPVQPTA